jgi:Na+-driven multidrug efflux pump
VLEAKRQFRAIQLFSICIISIVIVLFLIVKERFFSIFTSDPEVLSHSLSVSTVVCLGLFPDFWQAMVNGCIRALGVQQKAIKYNVIAYWLVNTNLIYLLAFKW